MVDNPYGNFNFLVQIGDDAAAGFTELTGFNTESEVIEYRQGNDPNYVRKLPGLTKFGNVTLKRGYTQNDMLWQWRKTTLQGMTERRDVAIILLDESRQQALRWNLYETWVNKYEGATFNATANEVAIESIEFVVGHWELAD